MITRIASPVVIALAAAAAVGSLPALAQEAPRAAGDTFDCLLEPHLRIKLATPVAGVVKEVLVDRGSMVRQGELVARLESGIEEATLKLGKSRAANDATLNARKARMAFLQRKRERLTQLRSKGATSEAAFDEAESDYEMAENDVREAEFNLDAARLEADRAAELLRQRSIISPLDGVVVERALWNGEYAYEQAPIMTLAQIDPLNVEVYLPISLYGAVTTQTQAEVLPEAPIGGRYVAAVDVIDTVFDSRSGTFGLRLKLPNPGGKVPAGLRCKARFLMEKTPRD